MSKDLIKVKQLRDITGLGLTQCKTALEETSWDLGKAEDYLRVNGSYSKKLDSRNASDGSIFIWSGSVSSKTMIHLACETDFVAQNSSFCGSGLQIAKIVNSLGLESADQANESDEIVALLDEVKSKVKENVVLKEVVTLSGDQSSVFHYLHNNNSIGVLLEISGINTEDDESVEMAQNICLHIAASKPVSLCKESIPEDTLQREKGIHLAQLKGMEGKPEEIRNKIVNGKLAKFYKEVCLLEQPYVKDTSVSVGKYIENSNKFLGTGISVIRFSRYSK
jgi:elongation factor Ts